MVQIRSQDRDVWDSFLSERCAKPLTVLGSDALSHDVIEIAHIALIRTTTIFAHVELGETCIHSNVHY